MVDGMLQHIHLDARDELNRHLRVLDDERLTVAIAHALDLVDEIIYRNLQLVRNLPRWMVDIETQHLRRDRMPRKRRGKTRELVRHAHFLHVVVLHQLDKSTRTTPLDHEPLLDELVDRPLDGDAAHVERRAHLFLQRQLLPRLIGTVLYILAQAAGNGFIFQHMHVSSVYGLTV